MALNGCCSYQSGGIRSQQEEPTPAVWIRQYLSYLEPGRSGNPLIKQVSNEALVDAIYDDFATGGRATKLHPKEIKAVVLDDGTRIGLRGVSKSGHHTVEIKFPGEKHAHKIHVK